MPFDKQGAFCWMVWEWTGSRWVPLHFINAYTRYEVISHFGIYARRLAPNKPFEDFPSDSPDTWASWMRTHGFRAVKTRIVATFDTTRVK